MSVKQMTWSFSLSMRTFNLEHLSEKMNIILKMLSF